MFLVKFVFVIAVIAACYLFVQLLLESDDPGVPVEPDGSEFQGSDDEEGFTVGDRCDRGDRGRCGGGTEDADRVPGLRGTLLPGRRCGSGGCLPVVSVDADGDCLAVDELRRNDLPKPNGDYDARHDWRGSLGSYGA